MDTKGNNPCNILIASLDNLPEQVSGQIKHSSLRPESALARVLTAQALRTFLGREPSAAELSGEERSDKGKPFFPAFPDFHYNISHSGKYVVCAFSDRPVGIDLQEIPGKLEQTLKLARRFFSEQEYSTMTDLLNNSDPAGEQTLFLFTRFWTARESYIKLTGQGLSDSFKNFRPDLEN